MCLPQCPTYLKTLDEGESPRGRISLIQALINNQLALTPQLVTHLSNCLKCRACEDICPSQVPYGLIIDQAQRYIESNQALTWRKRFARHVFYASISKYRRLTSSLLHGYQSSGLRWLAQKSGLLASIKLARWDNMLPVLSKKHKWKDYYAPKNTQRGTVALFTGCISDIVEQNTLASTISVLTRFGYRVILPKKQTCCGALYLHNGNYEQAYEFIKTNLSAFAQLPVEAIISTASGCGLFLHDYAELTDLSEDDKEFARSMAGKVRDINDFLTAIEWPKYLKINPLHKRVAVHDPCSLTRILRQQNNPYRLLEKIPGIDLYSLPSNNQCCGAAGSYMLTHPEMANRLREDKLADLLDQNVDLLVTSNVGCALHLRAGLKARHQEIEVLHPIELLNRQVDIQDTE